MTAAASPGAARWRVLLAHSYYGSSAPSGENAIFEAERDLLAAHGHEVRTFTRHSDALRARGARGLVSGALATPWNPFVARELRRVLRSALPDVLHVHNTFPLLSPAVFHATRGLATATVLTLHNHRLYCAAATLARGGAPCTECLDRRSVVPALRHGCYRDSRLATAPLALSIALHRRLGTWVREVDAFVALTEFARGVAVRAGLPADRIHVKPNFHPDPPAVVPWAARRPLAMYVGRLSPEKGAQVLVEAWRRWGAGAPPLEIAGDGPERSALVARAEGLGNVRFLGPLPPAEIAARLGRARLLVVPSTCFEGFPLVVREAYAAGVPVAASRLGALPAIVEEGRTGLLFAPGDAGDLARAVARAWADDAGLAALGAGARAVFETRYTADSSHEALLGIYAAARARRAARAGGR
ncbi:MAG TPA: glycosyltransferase [Anaeromyxobacteraceae bacterium]|nr:glycosyltransferase [Anaeromyxobacteraceae bacterium]